MTSVFYAISKVILNSGDSLDIINYHYRFLLLIIAVMLSIQSLSVQPIGNLSLQYMHMTGPIIET